MQSITSTVQPYQTFKVPGSTEILSEDNLKTSEEIKNTYYVVQIAKEISDANIVNMITKGTGDSNISYWLNSPMAMLSKYYASFGMQTVSIGFITGLDMGGVCFNADGAMFSSSYAVRPVVTLESDIELEGNSENGWTIK